MSNVDDEHDTGTGTGTGAAKKSEAKPLSQDDRIRSEEVRRNKKLQAVLNAWTNQANDERELRKLYAKRLIVALFVQSFFVNLAFFSIGFGWLTVDEA